MKANSKDVFIALLKAGLWERELSLSNFGVIDFNEVYLFAEQQSVLGLAAAGIEHVIDIKVPQESTLMLVGNALQLEQRNISMNTFVAWIVKKLREEGVFPLIIKGQGIAQCYERPLWRAAGDIDILLDVVSYEKAKQILSPIATKIEKESFNSLHLGLTINSWIVELHGSLRSCCLKRMDTIIDKVQKDTFFNRRVRVWNNNGTEVLLPDYNNDVFFVFTHIIKHFFHGGVGLRQICDWCRLLWESRGSLDVPLLEKRVKAAGILSEWKAFAFLAVNIIGLPVEAMPLYTNEYKWNKKATRIFSFIMDVGNFGHNRDDRYMAECPYYVRKAISLSRRTSDGLKHFLIFPLDSIRVWIRLFTVGIIAVIKKW